MKKVFSIAIATSISIAFATTVFSQAPPGTISGKTTSLPRESKAETNKPLKVRVKVKNIDAFMGTVVNVDASEKIIAVAKRGIVLTFDIPNPTFRGYKDISEVKVGDYVSITSTDKGIRIAKTSAESPKPLPHQPVPKPPKPKKLVYIPKETPAPKKKSPPVRMKAKRGGKDFRDVDNNQDGKIFPIELSVIIPDLTIKQFREYDKNGDGYLDESEYNAVIKRKR